MNIQENISLKPYNTFGIEANGRYFCEIKNISELKELLLSGKYRNIPKLILGGGSNVLFTQDFDGLIIKISITGHQIIKEDNDYVHVRIGAGENWHQFVLQAIDNHWGGIENLSLIPGTVGAAPMQNIGAYGVEIKEVFKELEAIDLRNGELRRFNNEDCKFGYRESVFKNIYKDQYIITSVTLELTKTNHQYNISYGAIKETLKEMGVEKPSIQTISKAVIHIRESKLPNPAEIGNAGSFFKNPTVDYIDYEGLKTEFPNIPGYELPGKNYKIPAAWLIEQCGWKGKKFDNIGVHEKQSLVLVNYGNGKGSDIKDLAYDIRQSVSNKFGIELNPEVNIV
ncbi:UDP-N-acetylmuramate dehydrogenase [Fulvivirgaceae bacterium BMA10]|uniref:UDP-N-acetylenolpyruvoylglucosamine reductase n=1 Tax=Splendidivirga corallicola TaxID=3051826 RepID=A0ABT8KLH8_9BACT|nr:UDP-N-acetylmuramate dehydrogenase [Fulvivirgaceae bacterium BMA10]